MKNLKAYIFRTVLLIHLALPATYGQDYLITAQGDTISGELRPFNNGPDRKVIVIGSDKRKVSYPILKVRAYRFRNETFEPVRSDRGYEFMRVVKPGYLTLYAYQLPNQTGFDGLFLLKKDGAFLEVPNISFKKLMKKFLDDCPDVSEKIETDEWEKRDLHDIIDAYNKCVANRTLQTNNEVARQQKAIRQTSSWDGLEEKIKAYPEFAKKADAIEMIGEIKSKISRDEKIPNFMIEGLKSALQETDLLQYLDEVLAQTQN